MVTGIESFKEWFKGSNFSLGGMSSSLVGAIESNEIKHKYKLISSKEYYITSLKLRLKKALLGK